MNEKVIRIGDRYTHYKNKKLYIVIALAHDVETLETVVVYQALYDDPEFGHNAMWTRKLSSFVEKVMFDGEEVDRFILSDVT